MIREEIKKLVEKAIENLYKEKVKVDIERPAEAVYGDYASNIAMTLKKNPQEIANVIKSDILEKVEVKNGFINFFLSKDYLQQKIGEILKEKNGFGNLKIGNKEKVNVEFISANPTGPLTLGNGRGGFCGDVLSNVFKKAGYVVGKEYYINNTGEQVKKLGHSVLGDSEAVYKGEYIEKLKGRIKGNDPQKVGEAAADIILKEMIKSSVKRMGIEFDVWFSEKSLYQKKEVEKALKELKEKGFIFEKEGAIWFKSTEFNDDKDRVVIKADGATTYLASDIAYLKNKFKRGFSKLVFFWGADHYGYIARIKAAAEALDFEKEKIDIVIMQMVRLFEKGVEVKMSKRSGIYITIDEVISEVGLDVARFFFLTRSPGSHLNFNLDLAKEQSEKNPVYYVQYAHARICSILKKIKNPKPKNLKLLNHPSELNLIKQLMKLPEIIEDTARDYQVQRIPQYAMDLAAAFHQFYRDCKVLNENEDLMQARLGLILATEIILKNTLDLIGISAPEKM